VKNRALIATTPDSIFTCLAFGNMAKDPIVRGDDLVAAIGQVIGDDPLNPRVVLDDENASESGASRLRISLAVRSAGLRFRTNAVCALGKIRARMAATDRPTAISALRATVAWGRAPRAWRRGKGPVVCSTGMRGLPVAAPRYWRAGPHVCQRRSRACIHS
jgi:hypothetical protein